MTKCGILNNEESIITVGDFNRPINNPKMTWGKRLLIDWIKEDTMNLINKSQAQNKNSRLGSRLQKHAAVCKIIKS